MNKVFRFMEEKYEEEILTWLTYLAIPFAILFLAGYLIGGDAGNLLMSLGFIIPFTFCIIARISLKYGGKHILSIASFGGLSFGMIIMYFGLNVFNIKRIDNSHFILLAIIFMGIFAVASSRRKFSDNDELIQASMGMMVTFTIGAIVGVILALLFSMIFNVIGIHDRVGVIIGFLCGIVITVVYLGSKFGDHFDLGKKEIYSPVGSAIVGTGIGGIFSLAMSQIYLAFYNPFSYGIGFVEIPLAVIVLLIGGAVAGFLSGYLTQKLKIKIDEKVD